MNKKDLIHKMKDVAHRVIPFVMVLALLFGFGAYKTYGALSPNDKSVNDETKTYVMISKIPSESEYQRYYQSYLKAVANENQDEKFRIAKKMILPYIVDKPTAPSKKPTLKVKRSGKNIKVKLKSKIRINKTNVFEIQYSKNKNFKNKHTIRTNKKSLTIKKLNKKCRYYVRARIRRTYYIVKNFTAGTGYDTEVIKWEKGEAPVIKKIKINYIDYSLEDNTAETFSEHYTYSKWSGIKSIKTK